MTFAFEFGDDPILIVDLPLAENHVLLGSGQKIKKCGAVHVTNQPGKYPPAQGEPADRLTLVRRSGSNEAGPTARLNKAPAHGPPTQYGGFFGGNQKGRS